MTMHFIASPELVTAFAAAGRRSFNPLTDRLTGGDGQSRMLEQPQPAPDVPPEGFVTGRIAYVPPPPDGRDVILEIDPDSERLQRMSPWPAWDGQDFLDMPVLVKTQGKTTTDHISPAGPWLRYRGHLERFSDNMFMGAVNAFTGAAGKGINVLSGEQAQAFAAVARAYRSAGVKWLAIGDDNYGEGSSREHATLSPRLLGGVAVIARSFARIHQSNLKKQGLLALTFRDRADYDRIRQDDRISLLGLAAMAPGNPVDCLLRHADGSQETLLLSPAFSARQRAWFHAGGALNLVRRD